MAERDISAQEVETEHLETVHVGGHWAYVVSVIGAATLGMLALIAVLDAAPR
jgi:hypothetical protein